MQPIPPACFHIPAALIPLLSHTTSQVCGFREGTFGPSHQMYSVLFAASSPSLLLCPIKDLDLPAIPCSISDLCVCSEMDNLAPHINTAVTAFPSPICVPIVTLIPLLSFASSQICRCAEILSSLSSNWMVLCAASSPRLLPLPNISSDSHHPLIHLTFVCVQKENFQSLTSN